MTDRLSFCATIMAYDMYQSTDTSAYSSADVSTPSVVSRMTTDASGTVRVQRVTVPGGGVAYVTVPAAMKWLFMFNDPPASDPGYDIAYVIGDSNGLAGGTTMNLACFRSVLLPNVTPGSANGLELYAASLDTTVDVVTVE